MRDSVATTFANNNEWNQWCILPCDEEAKAARLEEIEELEAAAQEQMEIDAQACADDQAFGWMNLFGDVDRIDEERSGGCSVAAGGTASAVLGLAGLLVIARRRD